MIVYRSAERPVEVEPALRSALDAEGDERLILFGELEAGIADALCPERDANPPELRRLRSVAEGIALWECQEGGARAAHGGRNGWGRRWAPGEFHGGEGGGSPSVLVQSKDCGALLSGVPPLVNVRVPEGYAYYALYPEQYCIAARRYFEECRPDRVAVIGIRSIGTSLSAVVAAELRRAGCLVWSCTVRPRGHPFNRHIALAEDLECELRSRSGWRFVIVDEGPGLSGSSFCGTALMLNGIGVPDERIAFFPSWDAEGSALRSEAARHRWPRHSKYAAIFEETTAGRRFAGAQDLSAGRWREILDAEDVPVHPQHERRKYLLDGRWYKFGGLGPYGSAKLRFSSQFTLATIDFEDGFVGMERVSGTPVRTANPVLLETLAAYLRWRAKFSPSRDGSTWEELMEMIEVNAKEGIGGGSIQFLRGFRSAVNSAAHVPIDGRMLPHEWLDCGGRYLKTDAADHHADHFFPGCQNIAWDVAGTVLEFGLPPEAAQLLDCGTRPLMPFYLTAYAAFRLGYVTMAAETLGGTPDGRRFLTLKLRYAQHLRALLATEGKCWQ